MIVVAAIIVAYPLYLIANYLDKLNTTFKTKVEAKPTNRPKTTSSLETFNTKER